MIRAATLVLLAACQTDALVDDAVAPPVMDAAAGVAPPGGTMQVSAAYLPPGSTVGWFASFRQGQACPAQLMGACLDLDRPVFLGSVRTGNNGVAARTFTVPRNAPANQPLYVQPVVLAGGPFVMDAIETFTGPGVCTRIYQPQCGVDGNTWGNECEAEKAGWVIDHAGPC